MAYNPDKDEQEVFYEKYRDCVNVVGKRVIWKVLEWSYKGGTTSYYDYLLSEYGLANMGQLLSPTQIEQLETTTPQYFEMSLIHFLLRSACNLYEKKTQSNKNDKRYEVLESELDHLLYISENIKNMRIIRDELDLLERIHKVSDSLMKITELAATLCCATIEDKHIIFNEIHIDTMKIFHRINEHWYLYDKCTEPEDYEEYKERARTTKNTNSIVEVCTEFLANNEHLSLEECKSEIGNVIASYNDNIMKHLSEEKAVSLQKRVIEYRKNKASLSKGSRKISKNTKDGGSLTPVEKATSRKKSSSSSSETMSSPSRTSDTKITTPSDTKNNASLLDTKNTPPKNKKDGGSLTPAEKRSRKKSSSSSETMSSPSRTLETKITTPSDTKNNTSCSDTNNTSGSKQRASKDIPDMKLVQARICAVLGPEKCSELKKPDGFNSSLNTYTDVLLKQHQNYSFKPGHQVKLKDLLNVEGMIDDTAEIIIVSGEGGMGKTWLMKYIEENWRGNQSAIDTLVSRKLLIPYELQKNRWSNVTQLVSNLLKDKIKNIGVEGGTLKKAVLDLPILVTLDGYDESCESSCQLVKEVLQMSGTDFRLIITCRPQYVELIYAQVPDNRRKHVAHLCLNGIPPPHHVDFVAKVIDCRQAVRKDNAQLEKIKKGLISRLPDIYEAIGDDLCNPLMLEIITSMWIEHPHDELNVEIKQLVV